MTPLFIGTAALISAVALLLLLRPLLWHSTRQAATRQVLNAAIYRDQMQELERDRASGSLSDLDHEQARSELQRRLLEDSQVSETAPTATRMSWQGMVLLALVLPTAAIVTYVVVGHPRAQTTAAAPQHDLDATQIEQMLQTLAARLEKNPGDMQGWAMLARSYKAMQRFDEAERAFARMGETLYKDPTLLAELADVLAVKSNNLEGKPMQLITKALQLDPNHMMSLSLAGTAAYNRNDFRAALEYWEHLYKLLPPESPDAQGLAQTLAEVRSKAGVKAPPAGKPAAATASVSGQVALANPLKDQVKADDVLFIYARPVSGSRMPLAVQRGRAGDLPLNFRLDDSMALSPDARLSTAGEVKIEARISKSGTANAAPGDLVGESAPVKVGASGVRILIGTVTK